ncbi:MAG: hypothetical protein OXO54_07670 [Chloroflexota bacterium]|nr:hypothetical protein [Chloroflexota bacterium]MDE2898186.1 hypothetical protein [Chloroflexota bacterium]
MPSPASNATLDDVVRRLGSHPDVEGVALGGSGRNSRLTGASDIDLLIVVVEKWSNLRVGVTWIEDRMGDLLFATASEVESIADAEAAQSADGWVCRVAAFLASARVLVDLGGRLVRAQRAAQQWPDATFAPTQSDAYGAWHKINYDREHNRRMLASDDPDYATALDVRLLYGLADVFTGYFAIRSLRWEGEKAALRFLREYDPGFLECFGRCIAERDQIAKFALYDQLCKKATAPVGGVWRHEPTSAHLRDPESATPEAHAAATAFVQSLVRGN